MSLDGDVCRIVQMHKTGGQTLYPCPGPSHPKGLGYTPCTVSALGWETQDGTRVQNHLPKCQIRWRESIYSVTLLIYFVLLFFGFFYCYSWKEGDVGQTRPGCCVFSNEICGVFVTSSILTNIFCLPQVPRRMRVSLWKCVSVLLCQERYSQCKTCSSRGMLEPDLNWDVPKLSWCTDKTSKSDTHFSPAPILEGSYWCQQDVGQPEITPFLREAASVSKTHPRATEKLISHI